MTRSRAERGFRERSLLRHLIEFGVALTLPMLIYLGVVLWKYADTERARMEDAALTLARSIAVDINQEIAGLAASLFAGDLTLRQYAGHGLFPMAAPTGGTLLILGWLVLGVAAAWPKRG